MISLEKQCREMWGRRICSRDGQCLLCGSFVWHTAHHIVSVRHHATRFDLDNGVAVCWPCHQMQKVDEPGFTKRIIEKIGQERYDRLVAKSRQIVHLKEADLRDILKELKGEKVEVTP